MARLPVKEGVARGVMVVTVTTFAIRLLGALYRPIVVHLFKPFDGADGLAGFGLAQAPSSAYSIVLSFTSIGFNVALARLLADAMARDDQEGARDIFSATLLIMAALGLTGAVAMAVAAPWLETASNMSGSSIGYLATAPAILIISLVAAFRGLFQGLHAMTPNATSQLLEAFVRIGAGIGMVWYMARISVPLGAAGLNLGDSAGALIALGYLVWLYRSNATAIFGTRRPALAGQRLRKLWGLAATLVRNAFPISLINAALPLMIYLDAFVLGHLLPGAASQDVQSVYGQLTAGFTIIMLPTVVTGGLASALIPALAEARARQDSGRMQRLAAQAYRFTLLAGWPASLGLAAVGGSAFLIFYGTAQGAQFMWCLALGVVPIMLQQTSAAVLQGMGRLGEPVVSLAVGVAVKVLLGVLLVPRIGGAGVAWGTAAGFLVSAALNIRSVGRLTSLSSAWLRQGAQSAAAAALMAGVVLLLTRLLGPWAHGRLALALTVALEVGAGAVVYGVALLLLGGVEATDLSRIPFVGRRLSQRIFGE